MTKDRKDAARKIVDRLPTAYFDPLTLRQLEGVTDKITHNGERESCESLIVLMDEIERTFFSDPGNIENVTVPVKNQAYHRMNPTDRRQQGLIAEVRGRIIREAND